MTHKGTWTDSLLKVTIFFKFVLGDLEKKIGVAGGGGGGGIKNL